MNASTDPTLRARVEQCRCSELVACLDRLAIEAERIETLSDGVVEFLVPTIDSPLCGDRRRVLLILEVVPEPAEIDADLARHTAAELRRIAGELVEVAATIEGGAA